MSLDISLYVKATIGHKQIEHHEVHEQNITHNLTAMASEAGIYKCVWRPDENGVEYAWQLTEPLTEAIADMKARPEHYEQFNAPNGWGLYKHFLHWLEKLLSACKEWPEARIEVCR